MSIYDSRLWLQDIEEITAYLPELKLLENKSVLITGIGGLIGSAIAYVRIRYNETHDNPIAIFAAARSKEKIEKRFGEYTSRLYFVFVEYDALKPEFESALSVDYIIHRAGNVSPNHIVREPVETMGRTQFGMV